MQWIRNFIESRREKANVLFLRAHDDFAHKSYGNAYEGYMRAFSMFAKKNIKMKLSCLKYAAECATKLNDHENAGKLAYKAAILSASIKMPKKETLLLLQKASTQKFRVKAKNATEVFFFQLLFTLASKDFDNARKISQRAKNLGYNDKYQQQIVKTWEHVISRDTLANQTKISVSELKIPIEFDYIVEKAEQVMRAYASIEVELLDPPQEIAIKESSVLNLKGKISSHAPNVEIISANLIVGNRGSLIKKEGFEKSILMGLKETKPIKFILEPKIAGSWEIGPLKVIYSVNKDSYEIYSNPVKTTVLPPIASLEIKLGTDCIEEDFGYELDVTIVNSSKAFIDDVDVSITVPKNTEITTGTLIKRISSLSPSEEFNFNIGMRFLISARKESHIINVNANFGDKKLSKSIEIFEQEEEIKETEINEE